ncbi:cobalt-precorrin-6A reductase [Williamsia sp.]|uniref:cobalt-precorrin-6A reductase n=1 Tax=Williamsia sp. TaxID=1872085 RepID=UPI002F92D970
MSDGTILILGGTAEARALAGNLVSDGRQVVTSLAGRVKDPALPVGDVRIGGFGGVDGLATWLRDNNCEAVVDATHPFARQISANATAAAGDVDVPLLTLRRPEWRPQPGDRWIDVPAIADAARTVAAMAADNSTLRVFLTTGRQDVDVFADIADAWFLIRLVDPPERAVPRHHQIIRSRGPYTVDGELDLMREHKIDVVVTKNSGGPLVQSKLDAARQLSLPVVMVRRPAPAHGEAVDTASAAATWVRQLLS